MFWKKRKPDLQVIQCGFCDAFKAGCKLVEMVGKSGAVEIFICQKCIEGRTNFIDRPSDKESEE